MLTIFNYKQTYKLSLCLCGYQFGLVDKAFVFLEKELSQRRKQKQGYTQLSNEPLSFLLLPLIFTFAQSECQDKLFRMTVRVSIKCYARPVTYCNYNEIVEFSVRVFCRRRSRNRDCEYVMRYKNPSLACNPHLETPSLGTPHLAEPLSWIPLSPPGTPTSSNFIY